MTQSRRELVKASGLAVAGFALLPNLRMFSVARLEVIGMRSDALESRVWFDPIGVHVAPGVRLLVREAGYYDWRRVPDAARGAFPTVARTLAVRWVHPTVGGH
jgi:hypothetical protein